jgi:hypothetical protein
MSPIIVKRLRGVLAVPPCPEAAAPPVIAARAGSVAGAAGAVAAAPNAVPGEVAGEVIAEGYGEGTCPIRTPPPSPFAPGVVWNCGAPDASRLGGPSER